MSRLYQGNSWDPCFLCEITEVLEEFDMEGGNPVGWKADGLD